MDGETKGEIKFNEDFFPSEKKIDQMLSRQYSLDKLYIMPCLNEMKVFGSFDKENSSTRLQTCEHGVLVGKKMNRRLSNVCNTTKADLANSIEECTYKDGIKYVPSSVTSSRKCTHKTFWDDVRKFMSGFVMDHNKSLKFFMVSHHHRLLKTVLKPLLPKTRDNWKIANCMCFHFKYVALKWRLSIIYDGFPDKQRSNYFRKHGDNELVLYDSDAQDGLFWEKNSEKWIEFTNTYLSDRENEGRGSLGGCEIFLIRHGNAFHNKPLQLVGSNMISKKLNRNLDTNLTPMGILQARILGKYLVEKNYLKNDDNNVFCASYLNRAQHTCTELLFALNNQDVRNNFFIRNARLVNYQRLLSLETFFSKVALIRIMRKANYNIDNIVFRLADFPMNYIIGGTHGSLDKLYGPRWNSCSTNTMNDFLVDYFYGLLAWAVGQPTDIFKGLNNNAIRALVEDLCIEYNPELPTAGRRVIHGMLSGGKKKTRKKLKKRYRHKKTYSRRKKTKKRRSRRRRKSKK